MILETSARREKLHVVFEKPFIAAVNTHYLNALIRSTTHNRTNGGIHAGASPPEVNTPILLNVFVISFISFLLQHSSKC